MEEIRSSITGAEVTDTSTLQPRIKSKHQSSSFQPLASEGNGPVTTKSSRQLQKSPSSLAEQIIPFVARHSWTPALALILAVLLTWSLNPTDSNPVHRFIFLSYRKEPTISEERVKYGKGSSDFAFVSFYIIVLSLTRSFFMQEVLQPLARHAGILKSGKQARFMEQAYSVIYLNFAIPFGLYAMSETPVWPFNTRGMYEGYPHTTLDGSFKFYYLFQAAFWAQQALVLLFGLEKPRKDFKEFAFHHVVAIALIGLSYRFHFTHIGIVVYISHDISDFFLSISKVLNYLNSSGTVPFYALFTCVWIYLRHYINIHIIYSLFTDFKTVGPYELNWDTEQFKCPLSFAIASALLIALQTLNLVWLYYILRVAYRITLYNEQKDARSDDEDSEAGDEKVSKNA
ncbi:related to longevity-assurance protein LAG1 [Fusarium proliferatum]|nr:related to longevity-assurance protein LAG1 [Fusarium proliferatum]